MRSSYMVFKEARTTWTELAHRRPVQTAFTAQNLPAMGLCRVCCWASCCWLIFSTALEPHSRYTMSHCRLVSKVLLSWAALSADNVISLSRGLCCRCCWWRRRRRCCDIVVVVMVMASAAAVVLRLRLLENVNTVVERGQKQPFS